MYDADCLCRVIAALVGRAAERQGFTPRDRYEAFLRLFVWLAVRTRLLLRYSVLFSVNEVDGGPGQHKWTPPPASSWRSGGRLIVPGDSRAPPSLQVAAIYSTLKPMRAKGARIWSAPPR